MKRIILTAFFAVIPLSALAASPIARRDAFVIVWESTARPVEKTNEKPYADIVKGSPGEETITYAKARSILGDAENFRPDDAVTVREALTWIFRTRSVEPFEWDHEKIEVSFAEQEGEEPLAAQYGLTIKNFDAVMTEEELFALLRYVDAALAEEVHEVSLYSEKFHGKGTAFGESFDMHAFTAAHRSFPYNTLVRVTDLEDGDSIIVRINDRGPYVHGRDMDLSLASFLSIAPRGKGKIMARFERLGDVNVVGMCANERFQQHINKYVSLIKGVPHFLKLGEEMQLTSKTPFVVRSLTYPDGHVWRTEDWINPTEKFSFTPYEVGEYVVRVAVGGEKYRDMKLTVVSCK